MIDKDHVRVQRILEGKCELCGRVLPQHDMDCKHSMYSKISQKLERINQAMQKRTEEVVDLAQSGEITMDEFLDLIEEIQIGLDKDV